MRILLALLPFLVISGCAGTDSTPQPEPLAFLGALKRQQVGSVNYAYYRFGKGKPLLLINAFGMTNANWGTSLLRELGQRYEVVCFDNRGIGFSTDTSAGFTTETMASSTVAFIDSISFAKPDVMGWSMGADTAMVIAKTQPAKIGKLILVGADAGGPLTLPPTPEFLAIAGLPNPTISQVVSILFPPGHENEVNAYLQSYGAMPSDTATPDQRNSQLEAYASWQTGGVYDALPSMNTKTLLLHGALDTGSPIANAQAIATRMPNAMLVQFPNAGHAVLFQEQATCLALIDMFLKQ